MSTLWQETRLSLRPSADSAGEPNATYSLEERMCLHNVSAISIAVIHNGKLDVDECVGTLAADDPTPATLTTAFGACSVSKAVTAMAALRLVAQGRLSLDGDVNEHLHHWRLTDSQRRPIQVSLRQLLTHTAGVNIHGADGYDPAAPVPTLAQLLDGQPPSLSPRVHVAHEPGSKYQYSSGGYIVVQKLIGDLTGQSFEDAVAELLFVSLGMNNSTFKSDAAGRRRAAAHVSMVRRASPESDLVWPGQAAGGLWTTAGDLSKLVLALQFAMEGGGDFLPRELALESTRRQTPHHDLGLGLYLLGDGPARRFSHTGGYLGWRAEMLGWLSGGFGMAILINNGYAGSGLKHEIMEAVRRTYAWPV